MNKLLQIYAQFTLILALLIISVVIFWSFFPYQPAKINNPIQTEKLSYNAGNVLSYKLDYCKNSNTIVYISRAFIDGVVYSMPDISAQNPKGCKITTIQILIPNLPAGKYQLKVTYSYEVNPIRTVSLTYFSNFFEIKERNK